MGVLASSFVQPVPLVAGLVLVYLVHVTYAYFRLRAFRGPRCTGISNWPHTFALLGLSCHEWYAEATEKYGPIARVAPNLLMTSSPELWAHVNKHPAYKRSDWFYHAARIEYRRDNVFTQTDNEKHEKRRRQMMPGYSGRENLDLESAIDLRVKDLLDLTRSKYMSTAEKTVPMDLALKLQYFTLDVISSVGMGRTFGMLKRDEDIDDYVQSTIEGLAIANTALALGLSWLSQAPIIGRLLGPSPKDAKGFGRMMNTCFRFVDERVSRPTGKRSDMLASFIRHGLADDELRSEALEQLVAGSDTTASGLRGTLLHILTSPRVYAKLRQEVDAAVSEGKIPVDGLVSFAQGKQMPYLQAVIREGLRVWPPVLGIFPRDVPSAGDVVEVGGKNVFLPGGTCIGYAGYAMHRDKSTYGEDADVFRPERWFEPDQQKLDTMRSTNDLIFGHGRFMCLGKPVAQIELTKVVFELMRNFDITLVYPSRPWQVRNYMGLFAVSDMWVQILGRTS